MTEKQPPFVIHVSEMTDFPDSVYIGRENGRKRLKRSKWANPFKIGDAIGFDGNTFTRATAVTEYRLRLSDALKADLDELTGKPLACWCRRSDEPRTDDNMCHGDVLVELWKEHCGE